jgi:hypothetical protein
MLTRALVALPTATDLIALPAPSDEIVTLRRPPSAAVATPIFGRGEQVTDLPSSPGGVISPRAPDNEGEARPRLEPDPETRG